MTQDEKLDMLLKEMENINKRLDKQDEQLDYIVARLNHMREKAHAQRAEKTAWPK